MVIIKNDDGTVDIKSVDIETLMKIHLLMDNSSTGGNYGKSLHYTISEFFAENNIENEYKSTIISLNIHLHKKDSPPGLGLQVL